MTRRALLLGAVLTAALTACSNPRDDTPNNIPSGMTCVEGHEYRDGWGNAKFKCDKYERVGGETP